MWGRNIAGECTFFLIDLVSDNDKRIRKSVINLVNGESKERYDEIYKGQLSVIKILL